MFPRDLLPQVLIPIIISTTWKIWNGTRSKNTEEDDSTTTSMLPRTAVHFVIRYETILLSYCTYGIVWYIYIYNIVLLLHQRYEKIIQLKLLLMCAAIILVRDRKWERERERHRVTMYIEATICVRVKKAVLSSYRTLCECVCCQSSLLRM